MWLRLLHLLYDIDFMHKTIKHAFSMFYTLVKHGFLTNHNVQGPIYINLRTAVKGSVMG